MKDINFKYIGFRFLCVCVWLLASVLRKTSAYSRPLNNAPVDLRGFYWNLISKFNYNTALEKEYLVPFFGGYTFTLILKLSCFISSCYWTAFVWSVQVYKQQQKCGNKKECRENWEHAAFVGGHILKQIENSIFEVVFSNDK